MGNPVEGECHSGLKVNADSGERRAVFAVRRMALSDHRKSEGDGSGSVAAGGWGRQTVSKPAIEVTTDFGAGLSTPRPENHDLVPCDSAKAAIEVTTGFGVELRGPRSENAGRNPSASACEPFQEAIELGLSRGRNTMAVSQAIASQCPSCQNTK